MALQIANRAVIEKIEALAQATGLSKTAAVEKAVDRCWQSRNSRGPATPGIASMRLLAQIDRIPELPGGSDPLEWDEHGLPR